jgi:RNA polymerase sigma-70 factor (ECF subfamily)
MYRGNIPHDSSDPNEIQTEALPLMDWFYNFAFYLTCSRRSAKKITRRTYKKVLEYYDKTRGGADYKSWMIRIILNRVYEFYEKKREQEKLEIDKDFLFKLISLDDKKDDNYFNSVNRKKLLKILKLVPVDLRLPLIFQTAFKFNYQLSAEYIDIPEGTIASRIFRARKWIFTGILPATFKLNESQKIEYKEMKFLASKADSENLGVIDNDLQKFRDELQVQKLIKELVQKHFTPVKTPMLLKIKFSRKVRKLIKQKGN